MNPYIIGAWDGSFSVPRDPAHLLAYRDWPKLRERIDARLEIVATRGGSVARFLATAPLATAP